jgi:hypothetical protein
MDICDSCLNKCAFIEKCKKCHRIVDENIDTCVGCNRPLEETETGICKHCHHEWGNCACGQAYIMENTYKVYVCKYCNHEDVEPNEFISYLIKKLNSTHEEMIEEYYSEIDLGQKKKMSKKNLT